MPNELLSETTDRKVVSDNFGDTFVAEPYELTVHQPVINPRLTQSECLPGLRIVSSGQELSASNHTDVPTRTFNSFRGTTKTCDVIKHPRLHAAPSIWYHKPIIAAHAIQAKADQLTQDHKLSPYSLKTAPSGFPKCNIFVYDVMSACGVPLPYSPNGAKLTASQLNRALSQDPNFSKVWSRRSDEKYWTLDAKRFLGTFCPQDGDIAIWDNCYLEHTGILEETLDKRGNTYYAGRDTPSGVGHTNLERYWISSPTKGYGAPDAVYRCNFFVR